MSVLCACGCGLIVKTSGAKFVRGHHNRSEEVKQKKRDTCLKNFGVEYPFQSEKCRNKGKDTCLIKYGAEYSSQNEDVKKKTRQTWLDRYGVDNPSKNQLIKEKKKKTCFNNYGVTHPMKSDNIKHKMKNTTNIKYGGIGFASDELYDKTKKTLIEKYDVDNYSKTTEFQESARKIMIQRLTDQFENGDIISPMIGRLEPKFFKWLQSLTKYSIVRPEKDMYGCFPDGYIQELNMVIEFDEPYHKETRIRRRDMNKDNIYQKYNLNVIRIDQEKWEQDPETIKKEFLDLIKKLEINFPKKD